MINVYYPWKYISGGFVLHSSNPGWKKKHIFSCTAISSYCYFSFKKPHLDWMKIKMLKLCFYINNTKHSLNFYLSGQNWFKKHRYNNFWPNLMYMIRISYNVTRSYNTDAKQNIRHHVYWVIQTIWPFFSEDINFEAFIYQKKSQKLLVAFLEQ